MVSAVKISRLMAKKCHLYKVLKFIMEEGFWISQNGYYMTIHNKIAHQLKIVVI